MKHVTQARTALAEKAAIACPNPYEILGPVRVLRKELGLTSNDVTVLTALISFLPRDQDATGGETPHKLTVVFPSNASLSERANGIDERTLRRCLGRLDAAGLIHRKCSANGKRFPLRYGGIIRDAFGIDLSPLIQSHDALAAEALKVTEERERLRSLKAEALALRASLLHDEHLDEAGMSSLGTFRNILRRATLTADTVLQIIAGLRELGANATQSYGECQNSRTRVDEIQARDEAASDDCTRKMSGRNGQNVRQIESIKKELKKKNACARRTNTDQNIAGPAMNRDPARMAWTDFSHIADFFPDAPRTGEALNRVLFDIGRLLRIRQEKLMLGLQKAGVGRLLLSLDYLLGKGEAIRQPEAYFETILRT
ncbi:replication initiation protein RepC [Gemmobacter aquatilis]|uniref:Replication initiation protein RepC n=1 Tax=Gemmobacter aquatilis TaxID=933059 RepID=A0A1H8MSR8_9RHOB|nr:helix-turn-helix domain-containing protein [Gemmobacter aquatilis]SEO20387.1 replication initiation protein RepC [Gemmobacter aquatilis]